MQPHISTLLVSLFLFLCGQQILAQEDGTTTAVPAALLCNETNSMDFDVTQITGIWYEVARNPSTIESLLCAQLNVTAISENTLNISFTYSNTPLFPWVNQTMSTALTLEQNNTAGYNITYEMYGVSYPMGTYKLLDTNYADYAFVCGFTNMSDINSFFGIVLTRQRSPNTTTLNGYEGDASMMYAEFLNGTMSGVGQPDTCTHGGAMSTVQVVSTLLAFCYAILALLC